MSEAVEWDGCGALFDADETEQQRWQQEALEPAPDEFEATRRAIRAGKAVISVETEIDTLDNRISELRARKATREKLRDYLKREAVYYMASANTRTIRDAELTLSRRDGQMRVEVSPGCDLDALATYDAGLVVVKRQVDKTALKRFVEATGEIPDGVDYVQGDPILTVRRK